MFGVSVSVPVLSLRFVIIISKDTVVLPVTVELGILIVLAAFDVFTLTTFSSS